MYFLSLRRGRISSEGVTWRRSSRLGALGPEQVAVPMLLLAWICPRCPGEAACQGEMLLEDLTGEGNHSESITSYLI